MLATSTYGNALGRASVLAVSAVETCGFRPLAVYLSLREADNGGTMLARPESSTEWGTAVKSRERNNGAGEKELRGKE